MINSENIFNNIEKFDLFPSHQSIFNEIIINIEKERKVIIRGEKLSGKSFFCKKLLIAIVDKLGINIENTKIYDLPLIILKKMWKKKIREFTPEILQDFLHNNNISEIVELDNFDIIILDEINDFLFRDLLKINYPINKNQILIQVIENAIYYPNKEILQKLDYNIYQLNFPSIQELINMIENYKRIFNNPIKISKNFSKDKFKSLIS